MSDPLVVFAPGSMLPVQDTLSRGFAGLDLQTPVEWHPPNHSGILAREILQGAAADVFISANWLYVDELHQAGLVPQAEVLAGNRLVMLVRSDVVSQVRELADLTQPGLRVFVPPLELDPLAQYIAALFARARLSDAIAEKQARGEVAEHVMGLREGFATGNVDAAILYATLLPMLPAGATVVALPPDLDMHDLIVFGVGAVVRDSRQHPAAGRFVDFLIGSAGQSILQDAGFLPRAQVRENLSSHH